MYNTENSQYFQLFQENPRYKQLKFKLYCFDNLQEAFDLILNYINLKLVFVIINGSLYPSYYYALKENIKFLKCIPICIIFTSKNSKEKLLSRKRNRNYLTEEILKSINTSFYNLGGVSSDFEECINFIFNFYINLQNKFKLDEIESISYDGCITFECVYSQYQLILPVLYNDLMNGKKI